MTMKAPYRLLFLCTGNSARSIMAEALANALGNGRLHACSAGSHPAGKVHPLAIEKLRSVAYPTDCLRSKGWDEFTGPNAPVVDIVITVCDNAAGEVCPIWPGGPISAHWGCEDPAAATDDEQRQAFDRVFRLLRQRVHRLLDLPLTTLDRAAIQRELMEIGKTGLVE